MEHLGKILQHYFYDELSKVGSSYLRVDNLKNYNQEQIACLLPNTNEAFKMNEEVSYVQKKKSQKQY